MMDHRLQLEDRATWAGILLYGGLLLTIIYWVLGRFDIAVLPPQEYLFNVIVYCIPTPLLLDSARRQELKENGMLSQRHAAKSDAFRRILGMGGNALLQGGESVGMGSMIRRASIGTKKVTPTSDAPAGLGNWDNSCYQNSVLQALASLGSLRAWLSTSEPSQEGDTSTNSALQEMIQKLKDPGNNGSHIWTSTKLKNMSSWQQQDAQEYFSKVVDELDKDAAKAAGLVEKKAGLETLVENAEEEEVPRCHAADVSKSAGSDDSEQPATMRNPLEGLAAQRISCTRCGFSEGFSMNPFNCLTVPLGSMSAYDIEDCLHEYTKREDIEGVECRSCTLIQTKDKLAHMLPTPQVDGFTTPEAASLPAELRFQVEERLRIVEQALEKDDFSDKTMKQDCQISPKAMVSSTKTREALIGRAPQSLVIHVNRSVFDEMTGMQRKNYAIVRYPFILDLKPWMLDMGDRPTQYSLKAVVTHYGRHENGHYICYKKHPRLETEDDEGQKKPWWRLSDEDVSPVSEQDVLDQGGVFMLFYERLDEEMSPPAGEKWTNVVTAAAPVEEAVEVETTSTESTETSSEVASSVTSVEDVGEEDMASVTSTEEDAPQAPRPQPLLRTASPKFVKHDMGMSRSLMSV